METAARIGIDSYLEWLDKEGIPVATGLALNLFEVETGDWPRYGVKGAAAHLDGRGDYCNMFLYDIQPGRSTLPQRHIYEEVVYVLEGSGSTQLEFADGVKRSFEWGPHSMFAIPLNAKHRHFNASGKSRALLASTTDLPIIMNIFHNERFVFGVDFNFEDRVGKEEYFTGGGDRYDLWRGNSNLWETNFVPDLSTLQLSDQSSRGAGGTGLAFVLADGTMHAHISELPAGTYKKAHRHTAGAHVMCIEGNGYSLLWYEGQQFDDFLRVEWGPGTVFPPAENQFHQHFIMSQKPARYLGIAMGSNRYPVTQAHRFTIIGKPGERPAFSLSTKEGGDQIEYEDQDPRIHALWLREMNEHALTPEMDQWLRR